MGEKDHMHRPPPYSLMFVWQARPSSHLLHKGGGSSKSHFWLLVRFWLVLSAKKQLQDSSGFTQVHIYIVVQYAC